jgi:hypothetical protein
MTKVTLRRKTQLHETFVHYICLTDICPFDNCKKNISEPEKQFGTLVFTLKAC